MLMRKGKMVSTFVGNATDLGQTDQNLKFQQRECAFWARHVQDRTVKRKQEVASKQRECRCPPLLTFNGHQVYASLRGDERKLARSTRARLRS